MISIIICSRTASLPQSLVQNISSTIGCDYELIAIDNSHSSRSIAEAYNDGLQQARGSILCFQHDDLTHLSSDWGKELECLFEDPTIGLCGLAGAHFIPASPCYYSQSPYLSVHNIDNDGVSCHQTFLHHYMQGGIADVVAVDGQLLAMPYSVASKVRFDSQGYPAFHGYDMDISMQVQQLGRRVVVTDRLLCSHRWSDSRWTDPALTEALYRSGLRFCSKWASLLPMVRGIELSELEVAQLNELFSRAARADALQRSRAYRLGRRLLLPFRKLHFKKSVS